MTTYEIRCPCRDCQGHGRVTYGHSNDPSSRLVLCGECGGCGYLVYTENYENRQEASMDYKDAITITKQ